LVTAKVREVQNFAVSVNVEPGTTVTFRLDYEELLVRKLGTYKHVIYADPGQVAFVFMPIDCEKKSANFYAKIGSLKDKNERKKKCFCL